MNKLDYNSMVKKDIKNDLIFKKIFGKVGNEQYTKSLLEIILCRKINTIEIAHDVSLEQLTIENKIGILDIRAIIDENIIVNIEMQNKDEKNIQERTEKYGSNIYISNIKRGDKYETAKEVILINILNYTINNFEEIISESVTVYKEHRETEIKSKFKYYYIELPKVKLKKLDINDEKNQWLIYLSGGDKDMIETVKQKNNTIKKIDEEVQYLQGDEAERRLRELREKWAFTLYCYKRSCKEEAREEAMKEAMKKAMKEAMKKAMKKARKEVRKEFMQEGINNEKIVMVKKMLDCNIDNQTILKITGITPKELKKIQRKM